MEVQRRNNVTCGYRISQQMLLVVAFLFISLTAVKGQKGDTLSLLRDFASVSTGYQQMPLYLNLEIKSSSNFITAEEDTTSALGEFFLRKENSYVHFGEFEQLVNDSLALLVSNKLQQMILYTNAKPVVEQMKKWMGASLPDSSITKLAGRYTSSSKESTGGSAAIITLQSRALIYSTVFPKETIELQYDKKTKLPLQVSTLQRRLIRLDSAQYDELGAVKEMEGKLLKIPEGYFLVKEQTTVYIYHKIEQASPAMTPVFISDRIFKTEEGEYRPVQKYETYRITVND